MIDTPRHLPTAPEPDPGPDNSKALALFEVIETQPLRQAEKARTASGMALVILSASLKQALAEHKTVSLSGLPALTKTLVGLVALAEHLESTGFAGREDVAALRASTVDLGKALDSLDIEETGENKGV